METESEGAAARHVEIVAIALVSFAGLLLEVGYTRIVSFKLWYYYTYLVIGLALLGIGSGGIAVAIWAPVKRASARLVIAACATWGSVSIAIGYAVIARLPLDTVRIWDYGTRSSAKNTAGLALICFALFSTFVAIGVIISTILGRARDRIGSLYAADLGSAGVACVLAIPLISHLGPPSVIALAAFVCAGLGLWATPRKLSLLGAVGVVMVLALGAAVIDSDLIPRVRPEASKIDPGTVASYSEWGPVFRVDVMQIPPDPRHPEVERALLVHDGTHGSGIRKFDGDAAALTTYDTEPRALPFRVLGDPPAHELIIGSAGGNEILASLHFAAPHIEAVELNPVTVSLLTDHFADWTGHLADRPEVALHQGDGRTYLARSDESYDLIWYVAPDTYAATNAASSGAFVLSESYLYTSDMIAESLEHLTDDGIMVVQFGELAFDAQPNRTARYVVTARKALEGLGVRRPGDHLLVAVERTESSGDLSTIMVKRTAFTDTEIASFTRTVPRLDNVGIAHAPGRALGAEPGTRLVGSLAAGTDEQVREILATHAREIGAITDDAPFFWHFTKFRTVLGDFFRPMRAPDPEDSLGERVLILLLGLSVAYAAVFLLLPFLAMRRQWQAFRAKGVATVYFGALGLGFMFFEITMIQRLVRFLGYPTYSLTVTLAAILVSTGVGSLASRRFADQPGRAVRALLAVLAILTLFYRFALDGIADSLQAQGLTVRVIVAVLALLPLGLCLGMFMPLGLTQVSHLGSDSQTYVAWSWAVNGFCSVIGSVLTTILSMALGFRAVQAIALAFYAIAVLAFVRLQAATTGQSTHGTAGTLPTGVS